MVDSCALALLTRFHLAVDAPLLPLGKYTMLLPQVKTTLPLASMTGEVGRPVMEVKAVLATVWLCDTV